LHFEQFGEREEGRGREDNAKAKNRRSFSFFKHYEALEGLTQELSNNFSPELTIIVVYLGVALVSVLSLASGSSLKDWIVTAPDIVLHFTEIFLLCNSANRITKEVENFAL
jgi:hypothetical protein